MQFQWFICKIDKLKYVINTIEKTIIGIFFIFFPNAFNHMFLSAPFFGIVSVVSRRARILASLVPSLKPRSSGVASAFPLSGAPPRKGHCRTCLKTGGRTR